MWRQVAFALTFCLVTAFTAPSSSSEVPIDDPLSHGATNSNAKTSDNPPFGLPDGLVGPALGPKQAQAEEPKVTAAIDLGSEIVDIAIDQVGVWVLHGDDPATVSRIDPEANTIVDSIDITGHPKSIAVGEGRVWVTTWERIDYGPGVIPGVQGWLTRIDADTGERRQYYIGNRSTCGLGSGFGAVWMTSVTEGEPSLIRFDVATGTYQEVGWAGCVVAVGTNAVWASPSGQVQRIDPSTGDTVATVPFGVGLGNRADFIGEELWIVDPDQGLVGVIDSATNTVRLTIPLSGSPTDIAGDRDLVWVAQEESDTVALLDRLTGGLRAQVGLGTGPTAVEALSTTAWVGHGNSGTLTRIDLQSTQSWGTFVDVDGNVHEGFIEAIAAEGITRGCNPPINDKFCPSATVTRGQMAAFLVRALGLTDDGGGNSFVDDNGSVFEADIAKLAAAGITRGCNPPTNDRFCPDRSVTRGQMAAFLVRALGLTDDGGGNTFTDDDGSTFEADIAKLAAAGITKGCNPPTNDRFCPDDPVRRDQMASFLGRALNLTPIQPPGTDLPELCRFNISEWVEDTFEDLDGDGLDERFQLNIDEDTGEVLLELSTRTDPSGSWQPAYSESLFRPVPPASGAEVWWGDLTGDGKRELVTCATQYGANDSFVVARVLSNHGGSWQLVWRPNGSLDDGIVLGQRGVLTATETFEFIAGQCTWSEHSTYRWNGFSFSFESMTVEIHRNESDRCESMFP